MKDYLPSKKLIIFIIFVILCFCLFLFKDKIFPETKYTEDQKTFLNTKVTDFATTDTDQDGLYDWEEALWSTDPKKIDTDSDGTTDKEYVENRKKELGISDTQNPNDASLTETERISREFFTIISSLEQKGLLNEESVQNVGEMFSEEISKPIEIKEDSIDTNFETVEDTPENKAIYKTQMMSILEKGMKSNVGKEIEYFAKFIPEPNSKNEDALVSISKAYGQMATDFGAVSVPKSAEANHKEMIINSAKLELAVKFLTYYEKDTVLTAKGFVLYKQVSPLLENNIYSLSAYFKSI